MITENSNEPGYVCSWKELKTVHACTFDVTVTNLNRYVYYNINLLFASKIVDIEFYIITADL